MIAGPETNEIITLNLPSDGGFNFAILVKICLCFRCPFSSFSTFLPSVKHKKILSLIFSLFFTYPIMLFPVTSILEKKLEVKMEKYKIQSVLYTNTICIIHKYNLYTCRLLKDQPQPSSCVSSLFFSPALLY